jgi:hypothetical protein
MKGNGRLICHIRANSRCKPLWCIRKSTFFFKAFWRNPASLSVGSVFGKHEAGNLAKFMSWWPHNVRQDPQMPKAQTRHLDGKANVDMDVYLLALYRLYEGTHSTRSVLRRCCR